MAISKNTLKRQYSHGAGAALDIAMREIIQKRMTPEEAIAFVACFANTVHVMVASKDIQKPFLTRALGNVLAKLGIESYESVVERMTESHAEGSECSANREARR